MVATTACWSKATGVSYIIPKVSRVVLVRLSEYKYTSNQGELYRIRVPFSKIALGKMFLYCYRSSQIKRLASDSLTVNNQIGSNAIAGITLRI